MSASETVIYLDYNATTPIDERVFEAMLPYLKEKFGNAASRTHAYGWEAEKAVDEARRQVAGLIGARPAEIVWTSGATESTNLALKGLVEGRTSKRNRIVSLTTEHKATLDTAKHLGAQGLDVVFLPVGQDGLLDLDRLDETIGDDTLAVSVMQVNNETGVIQDVARVGALCRERGAFFHCDAAQSFGKLPIDVEAMNIDLLSCSGHKIYAPKGVGFLYVRSRDPKPRILEQINGGGHEGGRRSGTLAVPLIVALGRAAEVAGEGMVEEDRRLRRLRDRLLAELRATISGLEVNGSLEHRIANNLNVSIPGIESEALLMSMPRLAVSTGSACNSSQVEASYVLRAMGLAEARGLSALRFGLGRYTSESELDEAVIIVSEAVTGLRALTRP